MCVCERERKIIQVLVDNNKQTFMLTSPNGLPEIGRELRSQ